MRLIWISRLKLAQQSARIYYRCERGGPEHYRIAGVLALGNGEQTQGVGNHLHSYVTKHILCCEVSTSRQICR